MLLSLNCCYVPRKMAEASGLHIDRTARRDRHHCDPCEHAAACFGEGKGKSATSFMCFERETAWGGYENVCGRSQWKLSAADAGSRAGPCLSMQAVPDH